MQSTHAPGTLSARDTSYIETDANTVRWIAQAAVNVELFTIPLYMTALYSITGMHPITGAGNAFYKGRLWPGAKPSVDTTSDKSKPGWGNKQAFNLVFSVFIQEMLHLQLASNLFTAISVPGTGPDFTSTALQDCKNGWTCYGAELHELPGIVDLRDTDNYADVAVNVGPLDSERLRLFLAIEQPQETAEDDIVRNRERYFPTVPFDFDPSTSNRLFGSIGYMYQCYRDYLSIRYTDGTTLWDHVFNPNGLQNDMFNSFSFPGHPMREFMGFEATIALTDKDIAFAQALEMMNAITDQGEGATLKARIHAANSPGLLSVVQPRYCPSEDALKSDYPSYSDTGTQIPSADAAARFHNDGRDHYERFHDVQDLMDQGGLLTWDQAGKAGNWTADDLKTAEYEPLTGSKIPLPEQIADALNALYTEDHDANYQLLSQAVVGAIKGVTTVLNHYWNPPAGTTVGFPYPSMVGSGDRMAAAWSIFGKTPDLSQGVDKPDENVLNHACQGLSLALQRGGVGNNSCADPRVFHTCRGSNLCKGMGGCGFVQPSSGGGSCGASASAGTSAGGSCSSNGCGGASVAASAPGMQGNNCSAVLMRTRGGLCGTPTPTPAPTPTPTPGPSPSHFTAPSDNICGGYGGCAVPISAAQVYPKDGTMDVYVLAQSNCGAPHAAKSEPVAAQPAPTAQVGNLCGGPPPSPPPAGNAKWIGTIDFAKGERVEDVAFGAFQMVAEKMGYPAPVQQDPSNLRLAFPPST